MPDGAGQQKLRLPAQSLPAQTGIEPTKVGFAAVGAVSTAGWLRRLQHDFAADNGQQRLYFSVACAKLRTDTIPCANTMQKKTCNDAVRGSKSHLISQLRSLCCSKKVVVERTS
jgi:hypothetical protein